MRLNTPTFWFQQHSLPAAALFPVSGLYYLGHKIHQARQNPYHTDIPVLCVGNLVAGGSGKTPTALAVLQLIRNQKLADKPCFLTRGYGGSIKKRLLVDLNQHNAAETGDEAFLLARKAPTFIAPNRKEGALYAETTGQDFIIMDDGLQNRQLHQDIKLIVIDGATGFGNHKMLPAGPLREPLQTGLQKADACILIGEDQVSIGKILPAHIPLFRARIDIPESWIANEKQNYVAFCGLAHPEKFKRSLLDKGLNIASWHCYPDHYNFTEQDLTALHQEAKQKEARLITTEKDCVRIPSALARTLPLDTLPIEIVWEDEPAFAAFLKEKIEAITSS